MCGKWQIKDRNAHDAERAAVNFCVAADFHNQFVRVELPFRVRQFAGGDGAIVNTVMIRTGLLDYFPAESEWVGRGQDRVPGANADAGGPMYVLKTASFSANIVCSMSSFDVLIIGTAIQHNMAIRGCISRIGVVIRRISIENIGGVMNFYLPAKMKDRTIFFLLDCTNGHIFTPDCRRS